MDTAERLRLILELASRLERLAGEATVGVGGIIDDLTTIVGGDVALLRRRVVRPEDLLALDMIFMNLRLAGEGTKRRLVRIVASQPSTIVLQFQGQAIGEQDFPDTNPASLELPVAAALSGPSRLAFRMPQQASSLDFRLEAILDACRRWPMALDPLARGDPPGFGVGSLTEMPAAAAADERAPRLSELLTPIAEGTARLLAEAGFGRLRHAVEGAARRTAAAAAADLARRRPVRMGYGPAGRAALEAAMRSAGGAEAEAAAAARLLFEASTGLRLLRDPRIGKDAFMDASIAALGPLLALAFAPHRPPRSVTAIEAPYRLFLAPLPDTGWAHATLPQTARGRTELWHTRLARRAGGMADESAVGQRRLRAIWASEFNDDPEDPDPALEGNSPEPDDRRDIVRLSAGFGLETEAGTPYSPLSIPAEKVILSALGASLDLEANWPVQPEHVNVSAWRHVSTWGRDHYVRIVTEGFLFPFGHRAAQISVTERTFEDAAGGGRSAVLRKRSFIVVREPVRSYPVSGQRHAGRDFPLSEVEILTRVTPVIGEEGPLLDGDEENALAAFFPRIAGRDFAFEIRCRDLGGQVFSSAVPLAFVRQSTNQDSGGGGMVRFGQAPLLTQVIDAYNAGLPLAEQRRRMPIGGSLVQYAPIESPDAGDVILPTELIMLAAAPRGGAVEAGGPRFAPALESMEVEIPAVKKLITPETGSDQPQRVHFIVDYLQQGFGGTNQARLFAALAEDLALQFGAGNAPTEDTGAFFEPNMGIQALSSQRGAIGDLAGAAANIFVPAAFFQGAKLLGSITIAELLGGVTSSILGDDVPDFVNVELDGPPRAEARLTWSTVIENSPIELFKPRAGGSPTAFDLDVRNTVFLNGDPPTTRVHSVLTNFKVNLFGFVILWFDQLEFLKEPGVKPDVNPDLHPENAVVFGGPLEFVNRLSDLIPDGGFADPPVLDISPAGIVAGYELDIPDLQVGILGISNIGIGARLRLPFDGDPVAVRFNFSEREDPFNLTVALLGGGGFFALALAADGVREVEAALEAALALAFDIGIASGGVYAKAGFYFRWRELEGGGEVEFTGFIEMGGELSVLGLIRVSLVLYLALSYNKVGSMSELRGVAKLVVEVEVLFFSTSVTLQVERRIGGSPADPRFLDFIADQAAWDRYAAAFA